VYKITFMSNLPKLPFASLRKIFLIIIFASLFFSSGYVFGLRGYALSLERSPIVHIDRQNPPGEQNLDFSLFWRVWDTVHAKYFDKTQIDDSQLVYGAIRGMVAGIGDPYTVFLPPSENKVVEEDLQGSFSGVGIQIGFKGTQLVVVAPLPGSPAEKAGVKPGDYIMVIEDKAKDLKVGTVGMTLEEAVQDIRGKEGTVVTLTLLREGQNEPIRMDIARQEINVPSVIVSYVGDDQTIAHVRLTKFAAETTGEWETAVADLLKNPDLTGMVFDLRNNPGGYLQGAVDVASDFLDTGDTVVIEEDYTGSKQVSKVTRIPRLRNVKMVVLVNGGSASASEIFSGAIRDNNRAKLVGETTFGKGTIQEPEQVEGGAGLHITIAKWLTPNGTWVHGVGLKPDVEVKDDPDTTDDEQLDKAVEVLKSS
jgi:carboxyl-terminal processing protease